MTPVVIGQNFLINSSSKIIFVEFNTGNEVLELES